MPAFVTFAEAAHFHVCEKPDNAYWICTKLFQLEPSTSLTSVLGTLRGFTCWVCVECVISELV